MEAEGLSWIPYIDPYGDTVLNRLQIPEFLKEWNQISAYARSEEEQRALAIVRQLAEYCLEEPHRYLRFYGD